MSKIYIVCGITGEYSDRSEWNVKAFTTVEKSSNYLEKLVTTYRSIDTTDYGYKRGNSEELEEVMLPLDPNFYEDYTGTSYYISEVELVD